MKKISDLVYNFSGEYDTPNPNLHLFTKWNWDYQECLEFQKDCLNIVKSNKELKIIIFCNHPAIYTHGRGLQKKAGKVIDGLIPFTKEDECKLSFPIHYINRGGGLTSHHIGQWIVYPIINLNNPQWTLNKHYCWLLKSIKKCLLDYGHQNVHYSTEKAGVWLNGKKIASIGVGIEKFITFHGLAFNVTSHPNIVEDLKKLHPCGLSSNDYTILENEESVLKFHSKILPILLQEEFLNLH